MLGIIICISGEV